jgi:hypothetical protein
LIVLALLRMGRERMIETTTALTRRPDLALFRGRMALTARVHSQWSGSRFALSFAALSHWEQSDPKRRLEPIPWRPLKKEIAAYVFAMVIYRLKIS